ncbi:MAG: DNRLRE domain-containing protein [Planctomycetales bacterium]|nr:DNRLRE domain-containing protein [Planctomycetales bacterium]
MFQKLAVSLFIASLAPAAYADVATFQQGFGYSGTRDTFIRDDQPNTNFDVNTLVTFESSPNTQGLLRFENLFGFGGMPVGSTINSASLTLEVFTATTQMTMRRMLADWDETALTWNNAMLDGNVAAGIQADDVEASTSITATDTNFTGTEVYDVTADVQAWANGGTAPGWVFTSTNTIQAAFWSSLTGTAADRPLLTVNFTAPVPEPATGGLLLLGILGIVARRKRR